MKREKKRGWQRGQGQKVPGRQRWKMDKHL
jgi:hypothetical protein